MGDHADDMLDVCEDFEHSRFLYRTGALSYEDAYYAGVIDESGAEPIAGHQKPVTCRYCGQKNLFWEDTEGRWMLFDGEHPHKCSKKPIAYVTCNNCLEPGLHWEQVNDRWLLHDKDGIHNCPEKQLKLSKFKIVKKKPIDQDDTDE